MIASSPFLPPLRLGGEIAMRGLKLMLAAHGREDPAGLLDGARAIAEFDLLSAAFGIGVARATWEDLSSFALPVLAFGEEEIFLITCIIGEVARVYYPLLGELTLLRPWVEERWSGDIAFCGPRAEEARRAG